MTAFGIGMLFFHMLVPHTALGTYPIGAVASFKYRTVFAAYKAKAAIVAETDTFRAVFFAVFAYFGAG